MQLVFSQISALLLATAQFSYVLAVELHVGAQSLKEHLDETLVSLLLTEVLGHCLLEILSFLPLRNQKHHSTFVFRTYHEYSVPLSAH